MDEKVLKLIDQNEWLNGMADLANGDPLAGFENREMMTKIVQVEDPETLWRYIQNYQGTFKYKGFYFANHMQYGCFVYVAKGSRVMEFENISFEKKERFLNWLKEIVEIYEKTNTVEEFHEEYFK
jgi:hypothetical protein